jgi:hypothetical protein
MDYYEMWVDLAPGAKDLEFVDAVNAWLGHFLELGHISGYQLARRKFGFGPDGLGEFHIRVHVLSLGQLEEAFQVAATRSPEVEALHAAVYSRVTNYKSGLYRDFPDAVRAHEPK